MTKDVTSTWHTHGMGQRGETDKTILFVDRGEEKGEVSHHLARGKTSGLNKRKSAGEGANYVTAIGCPEI